MHRSPTALRSIVPLRRGVRDQSGTVSAMLVLLPPSETKAAGGDGAALDLDQLSFPTLNADRARLARTISNHAMRSPRRAMEVLELGATQADELAHNVDLLESPTMPAIERYTGVLFDALDVGTLTPAARRRAGERLAVGSALFGLVRADDPIPAYRLSGGTRLPRVGGLGPLWRRSLGPVLDEVAARELVVDLRSGAYRSLAPVADAVTVRVLTQRPDGSRTVVSHHNKSTKGRLARLLVEAPRPCAGISDVLDVAAAGGLRAERADERSIDIVLDEP
jgi:cytoplasmic iron level regulating protein YaaA (DUF328/UPF0246 family)